MKSFILLGEVGVVTLSLCLGKNYLVGCKVCGRLWQHEYSKAKEVLNMIEAFG